MPLSASGRRLLVSLALLLAVGLLVDYYKAPGQVKEDIYLFVADARADRSSPLNVIELGNQVSTEAKGSRPIIQTFNLNQLIDSEVALEKSAETLRRFCAGASAPTTGDDGSTKRGSVPLSELFFMEIDPPYSHTKKTLRSRLDQESRLCGKGRVWFMNRLVLVVRPGPYLWPDGCQEMKEDFAYIQWQFHGAGLVLNDAAIDLLKKCKSL